MLYIEQIIFESQLKKQKNRNHAIKKNWFCWINKDKRQFVSCYLHKTLVFLYRNFEINKKRQQIKCTHSERFTHELKSEINATWHYYAINGSIEIYLIYCEKTIEYLNTQVFTFKIYLKTNNKMFRFHKTWKQKLTHTGLLINFAMRK